MRWKAMRFLCDEMLAGLGRWLRTAGYDTEIAASGARDDMLIARSRDEDRLLVTRDAALARRAGGLALWLRAEAMDEQARIMAAEAAVDWLAAPFTRCLVDNMALIEAAPEQVAAIPPSARRLAGPFRVCPACGRTYWPGSHARRMLDRLRQWAATAAA
jgi:uncharacterized protein with PIN domain